MAEVMVMQGREVGERDISLIHQLLKENPQWGRTRLSQEICVRWHWRNGVGQLKDMAARTLLLKLEAAGHIRLPVRRRVPNNARRNQRAPIIDLSEDRICCRLSDLQPLYISVVGSESKDLKLFNGLLSGYHYLGHRTTVGENMRYLIRDRQQRPLACLLFGSAAWKCADRDTYIGWDQATRERNLQLITNNTRFLVFPWVEVSHLASHILALVSRRVSSDWHSKYGHCIHALETFVDRSRFRGTCYKAANWVHVGMTKGRTRNDRNQDICVPIKDVYLLPLDKYFDRKLRTCDKSLSTGALA